MTPKQSEFLRSLIRERDTKSLTPEQQLFLARVWEGHVDLSPAQASRVIDTLLALPARAATVTSEQDVPAGRYAVINEAGVCEFFIVDRPTEGKWAGRTFVSQQASDEKYPVRNPSRREDVLARIAADPDALARYGQELGCCGRCGRTLTDEVSRATGIGPECAKILGMIRPSVEEVVAPAATPSAPAPSTSSPTLGWRERKAAVKAQQADAVGSSREEWRARAKATGRIHEGELPGTTWEDIFGGGA